MAVLLMLPFMRPARLWHNSAHRNQVNFPDYRTQAGCRPGGGDYVRLGALDPAPAVVVLLGTLLLLALPNSILFYRAAGSLAEPE
jgi:hypothetical protein